MQISWHGLGAFSITGKPVAGDVTLVTDPYQNEVGLRFPRTLSAAVVVSSHDALEANNLEAVNGMIEKKPPFTVTHAGEYEVQGIFVTGIHAPKKDGTPHTIYRITLEGVKIGFLGAIDRDLTDKELEKLGDIDVLIVPVGGGSVLNKDQAAEVVNQIEPRTVIPSYYDLPGVKMKLGDVEAFCKELACAREDVTKAKLSKSSLPQEDVNVIVVAKS